MGNAHAVPGSQGRATSTSAHLAEGRRALFLNRALSKTSFALRLGTPLNHTFRYFDAVLSVKLAIEILI